jgi:hypothetical protein
MLVLGITFGTNTLYKESLLWNFGLIKMWVEEVELTLFGSHSFDITSLESIS